MPHCSASRRARMPGSVCQSTSGCACSARSSTAWWRWRQTGCRRGAPRRASIPHRPSPARSGSAGPSRPSGPCGSSRRRSTPAVRRPCLDGRRGRMAVRRHESGDQQAAEQVFRLRVACRSCCRQPGPGGRVVAGAHRCLARLDLFACRGRGHRGRWQRGCRARRRDDAGGQQHDRCRERRTTRRFRPFHTWFPRRCRCRAGSRWEGCRRRRR